MGADSRPYLNPFVFLLPPISTETSERFAPLFLSDQSKVPAIGFLPLLSFGPAPTPSRMR